jgi:hypothetical protein
MARTHQRGDQPSTALTKESLIAAAVKRTGLSNFGKESFVEPLQRLIESLNASAKLHAFGRFYARQMLIELLCNRLYIEREWNRHPETHDISISAPLVILGLPRSGTTHLFNLLARDSSHRFLTTWEAIRPAPAPGKWARIPRVRRTLLTLALAMVNYLAPSFKVIHETRIDGPEECGRLLMNEFTYQGFAGVFNVPEYLQWLLNCDFVQAIGYHHKQLKLLQAQHGGKRWLLKGPCHLATIGPLMELYPDMHIIQTHRDPVKAIPSECSLMAALRGITSDELDGAEIGEQATALLSHDLARGAAAREKHDPSHFYDVYYNDLIKNPMTVLQGIYDHLKLPLTFETASKMRAELKESSQNKCGLHRYSLKQFSLDGDALRDQFHWYYQRFNVPVEQ